RLRRTRELTSGPIAVNLFVINGPAADAATYSAYVSALAPEAERLGASVGEPRFDDDEFQAKVDLLVADPVPVVSFTFGLPPSDAIERLRAAGSEIWMTVTNPDEAEHAQAAGA